MSRYDGLIIPRSYSEYINKTDAATLLQALQLSGVMDNAPTAQSTKPAKSGGIYNAINEKLNKEYWTLFSDWAPTSEQVMNTYINRKFSDYNILIFVIGSNNVNTRNTIIVPREVFTYTNESVYIFAHGSNQIVEVDIKYNDDTSIKIQQDVTAGNPFNPYIRIYGI